MPEEAAWGSATAKPTGGEGDPNVLSLKDSNRIRLLDAGAVKWRQHGISSPKDDNQFRSAVCPKGPHGRDNRPCPLCMKPVTIQDGKIVQLFAISRRFAANVWDYESESVKVLIAGPQVFEEFDAAAAVGMNPTESDYIIHKMGANKQTSYKLIRGDKGPLPIQITPDMLHDRDKYSNPDSQEAIFKKLEEMGIDYDSLEMPSFTLAQAEAFVMPYGKHKGLTIEQLVANDQDYVLFLHGKMHEQGSYGDPVFVAFQTVLEDRGVVESIEGLPTAPPAPATAPTQSGSAGQPTATLTPVAGTVQLIGPDGVPVDVPEAAKASLMAAGYTEPEPEPEPESVTLYGPDGNAVEVPRGAVAAMVAAGFTAVAREPAPAGPAEPADDDQVVVSISGTPASMLYAQAKPLVASGVAVLVSTPTPPPVEEKVPEPGADEQIEFKLNAVPAPIPMRYADAKRLFLEDQGDFTGDLAGEYRAFARAGADRADDKAVAAEVAQAAATDPHPAGWSPSGAQTSGATGAEALDPTLTVQGDDKRWRHPVLIGKDYASKGAVTQALNRLAKDGGATGKPNTAESNGQPATGKEAKQEQAKTLLSQMPEIQQDFKALLAIFEEVAGKRNITDFTEPELDALIVRLEYEKASAEVPY